jgi:hypothetical protein
MPLKPEDVAKNGLVQFPQVIISITPVATKLIVNSTSRSLPLQGNRSRRDLP